MTSHRPRTRRIAALALAGAPADHRRQPAGATIGARPGDFGHLMCAIVRHIDEALPVVVSRSALLVALGASALLCFASVRRRHFAAPTDRIVCKRRRGATAWARAGARAAVPTTGEQGRL
jgi:hypothetical protein